MAAVTAQSVVSPEKMEPDWVGTPTDDCAAQYDAYYKGRKLNPKSEALTTSIVKSVSKSLFGIVMTGGAFVYKGFAAALTMKIVTDNKLPYQAAEFVAETAHAFYTSKVRVPIDHDRIEKAVEKLKLIQKCRNPDHFIASIQAVYKTGFGSSNSSHKLMKALTSEENTVHQKIDKIIEYLTKKSDQEGFKEIYEHNGKKLQRILVVMVEKSTLT